MLERLAAAVAGEQGWLSASGGGKQAVSSTSLGLCALGLVCLLQGASCTTLRLEASEAAAAGLAATHLASCR